MKRLLVAIVIMALAAAVGCGKSNPLVGKWIADNPQLTVTKQFNADETWTDTIQSKVTGHRVVLSGTYTFDADKVTETQTTTIINGVRRPLTEQIRAPQVLTYKIDANKITFGMGGQSLNMARAQ